MYVPAQFYELALSAASPDAEFMNTKVATGLVYFLVLLLVAITLEILFRSCKDCKVRGAGVGVEDTSPWDVTLTAEGELLPKEGHAYYQLEVFRPFPRNTTGFNRGIRMSHYGTF